MKYKFFPHTADIKFRAYGKTLDEAFENVVLAVSEIMGQGEKIKRKKKKIISVEGNDKESLLYNFIEEIVYLYDAEHFVTAKAEVKIKGNDLRATFYGDDGENYRSLDHIKAATYAEMYVRKGKNGWEVQAVVDV